ncbi:hypothetical protein AgCh_004837 [Apium graveolens]
MDLHFDRDPSRIESSETQPPNIDISQVETGQVVGNAIDYNSEGDEILSKAKCKSEWWNNFEKIKVKGTGAIKARKDILEVIKPSTEKVKDSVAYWTATPKRGEKFEEAALLDIFDNVMANMFYV